jgi:hypothetical protein
MEEIKLYLLFAAGVLSGQAIRAVGKWARKKSAERDRIRQFKEAIENVSSGRSVFVSRVNQTTMIDMKVADYGVINLAYLMDKNEVAIFKDSKVLHTTEGLKEISEKLISEIMKAHGEQIRDVVTVMGVTISREEIESHLKQNMKDIEEMFRGTAQSMSEKMMKEINPEMSDVEIIIEENEGKLDIDSILDKINISGMKSLTKEELDFLKKQSQ